MLSSSRTRGPRCIALKYHSLKNPLNAVQPLWLHSIFFGIFNSHRSWKALPWLGELRSIQRRYRGQALARRWRVAEKLPGMPGPGRHPIPRHAAPAARPPPMCRGPRESGPCTGRVGPGAMRAANSGASGERKDRGVRERRPCPPAAQWKNLSRHVFLRVSAHGGYCHLMPFLAPSG